MGSENRAFQKFLR